VDVVKTSKGMKPLTGVGGVANQPGLELCNNVLQKCLSAPYNWRFNKFAMLPFTTIPYQQDYLISNCNAFCKGRYIVQLNAVNSPNGPGLTQSGTTVTALFNDFAPNGMANGTGPNTGDTVIIKGANQAGYNITAVILSTPTNTSFTYTATGGLAPDGGQGFGNPGINWMEHVSMTDFQSSGLVTPTHDGEIAASLFMESIIQPPIKWAFQVENIFTGGSVGAGQSSTNIPIPLIRAWPVPSSQIWGIYLFYQGKAPLKTDLSQTWAPWPDDLSYVLVSNLKAAALDWWEDPRSVNSLLLGQQDILKALGSKDQELRGESMFPDLPIQRGG
jgi:hypothetical protein